MSGENKSAGGNQPGEPIARRITARISNNPAFRRMLTFLVGVGIGIVILVLVAIVKGFANQSGAVPAP